MLHHADPATTMRSYLDPMDTDVYDRAASWLDRGHPPPPDGRRPYTRRQATEGINDHRNIYRYRRLAAC